MLFYLDMKVSSKQDFFFFYPKSDIVQTTWFRAVQILYYFIIFFLSELWENKTKPQSLTHPET
jgi:hypothetical protein